MNEKPKFQVLTAGGAGTKKASTSDPTKHRRQQQQQRKNESPESDSHTIEPLMSQNLPSKGGELEYEVPVDDEIVEEIALHDGPINNKIHDSQYSDNRKVTFETKLHSIDDPSSKHTAGSGGSGGASDLIWLGICFIGIMASFVCYGLLLEYTTSGGRKLHELSFLFVTSGLYTITAAAGRYVRDETPTTIPPRQFALLGLTSMGSTWCSVRSLRYVLLMCSVAFNVANCTCTSKVFV